MNQQYSSLFNSVTPISKLTALRFTLENISCQILRRVHIVIYKISHQLYMVTTRAKPYMIMNNYLSRNSKKFIYTALV
jgi:hypothetical protein